MPETPTHAQTFAARTADEITIRLVELDTLLTRARSLQSAYTREIDRSGDWAYVGPLDRVNQSLKTAITALAWMWNPRNEVHR